MVGSIEIVHPRVTGPSLILFIDPGKGVATCIKTPALTDHSQFHPPGKQRITPEQRTLSLSLSVSLSHILLPPSLPPSFYLHPFSFSDTRLYLFVISCYLKKSWWENWTLYRFSWQILNAGTGQLRWITSQTFNPPEATQPSTTTHTLSRSPLLFASYP